MTRASGIRVLAALAAAALLPAFPAAAAAKPERERHRIDVAAVTATTGTNAHGDVVDRGTTSGKPFNGGKIKLVVHFDIPTATATGTFRIRDGRGTALGTFEMAFVIAGGEIDFNGTADITGGKGAYKGIRARNLKAHDHNTLDGQNGTVELKGFARY